MNRSYSKIRHILESNMILEKRRSLLKEDVAGKKDPKLKINETGDQIALRLCYTAKVNGKSPKVEGNKLIFKVDTFRDARIEFGDTVDGKESYGSISLTIPEEDMGTKNTDGTYSNFDMSYWSNFIGQPTLTTVGGKTVYVFAKTYEDTSTVVRTLLGLTEGDKGFNTGKDCGTKCIPWGSSLPSPSCPSTVTTTTTTTKTT